MRRFIIAVVVALSLVPSATAPAHAEPVWADPETALIRPGIRLHFGYGASCTSNFVFTDAQGEIYLGTAAHCVTALGENVWRAEGDAYTGSRRVGHIGRVVYSSQISDGVDSYPCEILFTCSDEEWDDFALIKIFSEMGRRVNPSMRKFGGPTGVISYEEVRLWDRVLTAGYSELRPGPYQLGAREAYVREKVDPHRIYVTGGTGVFGDSGSGVISSDGRAVGTLVTLRTPDNGVVSLFYSLARAATRGFDVQLATWDLADGGLLPDLPR